MKNKMLLMSVLALGLAGCAHHHEYSRYHDRYYVGDEPGRVVIDRDGHRTYVREYDYDREDRYHRNHMEPYARGKGPEALGWNSENYYRQRGYY